MGDAPEAGDESEADEVRPTKVIVTEMALEVRCSRQQLDYEGRSDGRSMQTILTHIAPRHLVLCHGTPQVSCPCRASQALPHAAPGKSDCSAALPTRRQLDCEGRSDVRSIHTILTHIAPCHLVLCHGTPQVSCPLINLRSALGYPG